MPPVILAAFLAFFFVLAYPPDVKAAGTPDLQLGSASNSPLYGQTGSASSSAALGNGQPKGYNLSFRAVLPAGITYTGGAEFPPQVISDKPSTGETTLIFQNISDLVANSQQGIALDLVHDQSIYEVGDTYTVAWEAFVNTDPRFMPKFDGNGVAEPGTYTGSASSSSTSTIKAIKISKSEPSREGEILRGVHDNQTIYTLTLENNAVNPTASTTIDDYLPAGLEFLGCEGTPDSTTDAPTNPGSTQEYPGSRSDRRPAGQRLLRSGSGRDGRARPRPGRPDAIRCLHPRPVGYRHPRPVAGADLQVPRRRAAGREHP